MKNDNQYGTMKEFSKGLSEEDILLRNELLILQHQLSTVQVKINVKLEQLLDKQGKFKHEIKHNHNQIHSLLVKNMRNIFSDEPPTDKRQREFYYNNMEAYCDEVDALMKAVMDVKGIKDDIDVAV